MATKALVKRNVVTKPQSKWDRNESYRSDFLKYNKGIFGKYYFCVYCGKFISAKNMQVDHHIAINYVRKNPLLKLYFGICNIFSNIFGRLLYGEKWTKNKGVNVTYNLLPACSKCNNKKKDKGGIWIVRGMIGGTLWKLCNFINILISKLFTTPVGLIITLAGVISFLFFTPQGAMVVSLLQGL